MTCINVSSCDVTCHMSRSVSRAHLTQYYIFMTSTSSKHVPSLNKADDNYLEILEIGDPNDRIRGEMMKIFLCLMTQTQGESPL